MPPVKEEQTPSHPMNTSARIQQIFSEVQSQLPSVNFDNDDQNDDNNNNDDNEEILQSNISENTDALLESLMNTNVNSFLTVHPKIETPQQPPSVELQMRLSPNLFDNSLQNQESSLSKPSVLSMDLFNSIDFDRLPSLNSNYNHSQHTNITPTFHRPRPINHQNLSSQQQQQTTNIKNRDDRQILERLAQQANRFNTNERLHPTRENHPFRNLETALRETSYEHFDRHGKRRSTVESERKTIYIDLRNSNIQQKQEKSQDEQQSTNIISPISQQIQSSESDSDDDDDDDDDVNNYNDGMLWFEKRQQAKRQQQLNSSK
ncbi:unnamed protein product [Rotaria sordida]|uniref:Uncharacterized protein n=1 Tax=Rotaria sordida TaxID=392033 RepID=A0A813V6N8_9BILA|nr:unnamed protein product [Rotaria sordida]